MATASAILSSGKVYQQLEDRYLSVAAAQLLRQILGSSPTASTTLANGTDFQKINSFYQLVVIAELLREILGTSPTVSALLLSGKDFQGVDDHGLRQIWDELLREALSSTDSPSTTLASATTFQSLDTTGLYIVLDQLLRQIKGATSTPTINTLMASGKDFQACQDRDLKICICELLREIVAAGSFSPSPAVPTGFSLTINGTDTLVTASWTASPAGVDYVEVWTSNDNVTFALEATVNVPTTSTTALTIPPVTKYAKIRACSTAHGCSAFTSVLSVNNGVIASWASRVVANGGAALSTNTKTANGTFYNTLNAAGIWANMETLNTFAPDNLIACITPILKGTANDPWTNNNFVGADLTVNGLLGNGSTKYLDTGLIPTNLWPLNAGGRQAAFHFYNVTGNSNAEIEVGVLEGGINIFLGASFNGNYDYATYGAPLTAANGGFTGFCSASRTATTGAGCRAGYTASSTVPFNQIVVGSDNGNGTAVALVTIPVFCDDTNQVRTNFSSKRLSFAAVGYGISSADTQSLYNAVQTLRTSLGGGFV